MLAIVSGALVELGVPPPLIPEEVGDALMGLPSACHHLLLLVVILAGRRRHQGQVLVGLIVEPIVIMGGLVVVRLFGSRA